MGLFGRKSSAKVTDPVCGMQIDPKSAFANERHDDNAFYFCSKGCLDTFRADPHRFGHG